MKHTHLAFILLTILAFGCGETGQQGQQAPADVNAEVGLTVVGGDPVVYLTDDGAEITARYYTLSDSSLRFVKLSMPDGQAYTLPQSISGSGARYTDDGMLTWWIRGDSAMVEERDDEGQWQTVYAGCHVSSD